MTISIYGVMIALGFKQEEVIMTKAPFVIASFLFFTGITTADAARMSCSGSRGTLVMPCKKSSMTYDRCFKIKTGVQPIGRRNPRTWERISPASANEWCSRYAA